jgi:hypothetical protein
MGSSQKLHCAQVGQFSTGRVGQFCIGTDRKNIYPSIEQLQTALDQWMPTMMIKRLAKEECAVAARRLRHLRTERKSGRPKLSTKSDLTVMAASPVTVRSNLSFYRLEVVSNI